MGKIIDRLGEDHPRACGDYYQNALNFKKQEGSPPRMRGLFNLFFKKGIDIGITPAHAGTISVEFKFSTFNKDHPRACGDYSSGSISISKSSGSPPRMRGLSIPNLSPSCYSGITPAHAGTISIVIDSQGNV